MCTTKKRTEFLSFMAVKGNENVCIHIYYFPFNFLTFFFSKLLFSNPAFTYFATKFKQILKPYRSSNFSRALCCSRTDIKVILLPTNYCFYCRARLVYRHFTTTIPAFSLQVCKKKDKVCL